MRSLAPTPWRVEKPDTYRHWTDSLSIMDAQGGEVAVLTRGYEGDPETGDGCPSFTNGRLIAAAPDMLAALQNVQKIISEAAMTGFNWQDGDWAERLFHSQQMTSAAIDKATPPKKE